MGIYVKTISRHLTSHLTERWGSMYIYAPVIILIAIASPMSGVTKRPCAELTYRTCSLIYHLKYWQHQEKWPAVRPAVELFKYLMQSPIVYPTRFFSASTSLSLCGNLKVDKLRPATRHSHLGVNIRTQVRKVTFPNGGKIGDIRWYPSEGRIPKKAQPESIQTLRRRYSLSDCYNQ